MKNLVVKNEAEKYVKTKNKEMLCLVDKLDKKIFEVLPEPVKGFIQTKMFALDIPLEFALDIWYAARIIGKVSGKFDFTAYLELFDITE